MRTLGQRVVIIDHPDLPYSYVEGTLVDMTNLIFTVEVPVDEDGEPLPFEYVMPDHRMFQSVECVDEDLLEEPRP